MNFAGGRVRQASWILGAGGLLLALGCGDSGMAPGPGVDGQRLAAEFEQLADSVAGGGYSPTAQALRHAAQIVRLAGTATSVTLTIDGSARQFLAVAEQIDFPNLVCSWPADSGIVGPPDTVVPVPAPAPSVKHSPDVGGCTVADTTSMRTLIAWEPERMAEVVRIVAGAGSGTVAPGVPDVMVSLPATGVVGGVAVPGAPPDSAVGGTGGFPGFIGEYLVRDVGSWWAVEGEQHNALVTQSGACTTDRATFDWAQFTCSAAQFRFDFNMKVEPLRYEPLMSGVGPDPATGSAEGSHLIKMEPSNVDGVRLTVIAWTPPSLPPVPSPGPLPPDSNAVHP